MPISSVEIELGLDCGFPLPENSYKIEAFLTYIIEVKKTPINFKQMGEFEIVGNPDIRPETPGVLNNKAQLLLKYQLPSLSDKENVCSYFGDKEVGHISLLDRSIIELNRIIDYYRTGGFPYYLHHRLSIWNLESYSIYFLDEAFIRHFYCMGSGKSITFNGDPYGFLFKDKVIDEIVTGKTLPFYFLLYLNGLKSLSEDNFREAQINFANCCEALSFFIIDVLESRKLINRKLAPGDNVKARFSLINKILNENDLPCLVGLGKNVEIIWKLRNPVMHGKEGIQLTPEVIVKVKDCIESIMNGSNAALAEIFNRY